MMESMNVTDIFPNFGYPIVYPSEHLLNMRDEFRVLSLIEWTHCIHYIINYPIMKLG